MLMMIQLLLQVFGANEGPQSIGFQTSSSTSAVDQEDIALPYVQLLSDFREKVRNIARQKKVGEILKLCDQLRDEDLPNLGVKLEDQDGKNVYFSYLLVLMFYFLMDCVEALEQPHCMDEIARISEVKRVSQELSTTNLAKPLKPL